MNASSTTFSEDLTIQHMVTDWQNGMAMGRNFVITVPSVRANDVIVFRRLEHSGSGLVGLGSLLKNKHNWLRLRHIVIMLHLVKA